MKTKRKSEKLSPRNYLPGTSGDKHYQVPIFLLRTQCFRCIYAIVYIQIRIQQKCVTNCCVDCNKSENGFSKILLQSS